MRPDRTWIVIADGAHVSVVQCVRGDAQLIDVDDMRLTAELPPSRELVTDRPGRSFEPRAVPDTPKRVGPIRTGN